MPFLFAVEEPHPKMLGLSVTLLQKGQAFNLTAAAEHPPAVLLAGALVGSGHSVLPRLSTRALGPGLGQATGLSYWLRGLELPSS